MSTWCAFYFAINVSDRKSGVLQYAVGKAPLDSAHISLSNFQPLLSIAENL
jgi:hypothetical protein